MSFSRVVRVIIAVLVLFFLLFSPLYTTQVDAQSQHTFHLSEVGVDSDVCGSQGSPCATIDHLLALAGEELPVDGTLVIKATAGTFSTTAESVINHSVVITGGYTPNFSARADDGMTTFVPSEPQVVLRIQCGATEVSISNVIIKDGYGFGTDTSGISLSDSTARAAFTNVAFINNGGYEDAGFNSALYIGPYGANCPPSQVPGDVLLTNVLFSGIESSLLVQRDAPTFVDVRSTTFIGGRGVIVNGQGHLIVWNSVFSDTTSVVSTNAGFGAYINHSFVGDDVCPDLEPSCLFSGATPVTKTTGLFTGTAGIDTMGQIVDETSPLIDMGTEICPATDWQGHPRGKNCDVGWDEYRPNPAPTYGLFLPIIVR